MSESDDRIHKSVRKYAGQSGAAGMSDLRAALLAELAESPLPGARYAHHVVSLRIPEGAVLVTEETLAAALLATLPLAVAGAPTGIESRAAAIMRHLREGT